MLSLYTIDPKYLSYLTQYDDNVKRNHGTHQRPYIGTVFSINEIGYFAPLAHPRPKHRQMHDQIDFVKIAGGYLGVINLNNMIPVMSDKLIRADITEYSYLPLEEKQYRALLGDQLLWINRHSTTIIRKAKNLYSLYRNDKLRGDLKERCANYPLLEKACVEYEYPLDDLQQLPKAIEPDRLYLAAKPVLNNYQLINSFDFSNDGYEEGIFQGMSLHRDFAIFGINADQNAFAYKREMFESTDAPTFEEAIMSSPVTDLRQLEIFIGQQFEVMEKSPFLFR